MRDKPWDRTRLRRSCTTRSQSQALFGRNAIETQPTSWSTMHTAMRAQLMKAACTLIALAHAGCSNDDATTIDASIESTPDGGGDASHRSDAGPTVAEIGSWGFDLDGLNGAARPGDSFYEYANGGWLRTHEIPADRSAYGTFEVLVDDTEEQLKALIEGLPGDAEAGSNAQKVRDYYEAFVDLAALEQLGLTPAQPGLDVIEAARTHEDIARLMGRPDLAAFAPLSIDVTIDDKDPSRYVVGIGQSGLGLPDREYYLSEDSVYRELRASYEEHIARLLTLIGSADSAAEARTIVGLETQIAELHWPIEQTRQRDLTYNLRTREALGENTGDYPWAATLEAAGFGEQAEFVVYELSAVEALARAFTAVPVPVWIAYLKYHYVIDHGPFLTAAIDDERFDFYGRTLNGQPEKRERWKRAMAYLDTDLGEAVGELYVERYFPESSKAQMVELVRNLRTAFSMRLAGLPWMSAETKVAAQRKLDTFVAKIGYPETWKDYSALEVEPGDAFGNAVRAREWVWRTDLARLGRPTDRNEWFTTPQTVNAYYYPTFNDITFPAAILQPPFFDPAADPAVNYGAIGAVIGHEMGHGFDDQGAKSDERGVLRTWWQPEDEEAFTGLVQRLIAQYDGYEALPGVFVNGELTVGENIGDLGGVTIAYEAYRLSLDGEEAEVRDGFTGDQRFFLAWAQVWRELVRPESLRNQVMSDPHSPGTFRVNGVVRNLDAWYTAFEVAPEDALWLAPEDRVRIW
jgi:putative endopeptidase